MDRVIAVWWNATEPNGAPFLSLETVEFILFPFLCGLNVNVRRNEETFLLKIQANFIFF